MVAAIRVRCAMRGVVVRLNRSVVFAAALTAAVIGMAFTSPARATDEVSFGELELFDFGSLVPETRYGWTSGDALVTDLDFGARIGGITGRRNAQITPAVKAFGKTIIPAIRADTRTGARLTSSLRGETGVELFAGLTVGGDQFNAMIEAGPTATLPGPVAAGDFFQIRTGSALGGNSTFDPGLPRLDAGMDVILNGSFDNRFEYGLFPFAKYSVGEFGFDFDFDFNLFDFDLDLNFPDLDINFPDLPSFEIPPSQPDNTLLRQKLPPSNPALSIAEIAVDNPLKTISTDARVTDDGRLTTSTVGSVMRAGIDIDGIVSALASGGFSFTGTSVKIGPGKLGYDIIDVKYGVELGVEYDTQIDPFLNATLSFDKPVLVKEEDGSIAEITAYTGRWDELPEFALASREDVNVEVDFTDFEAIFSHTGALTLSDYMELQALKLFASIVPGVKLVDIGPVYYQKFPLAGELAAFELFDASFSLGSLAVPESLWDGGFVIEAAPIIDVALAAGTGSIVAPGDWVELDGGAAVTDLSDKTPVVGLREAGDVNRLDVTPVDLIDPGTVDSTLETTAVVVTAYLPGLIDIPIAFEERSESVTVALADAAVTTIDGLVVPESSSYTVAEGGARRLRLNTVVNDGTITGDGLLDLEAVSLELSIEGDGQIAFNSPGRIEADRLVHGAGHTITFGAFDTSDLVSAEPELADYPQIDGDIFQGPGYRRDGFVVTPVDTASALATQHAFVVGELDNAGTIEFGGSNFSIVNSTTNRAGGVIRVFDGRNVTFDPEGLFTGDRLTNSGRLEATGAGSTLAIGHTSVRGVRVVDPATGVADPVVGGEIVARDGGRVVFDSISVTLSDQAVSAVDAGVIDFTGFTQLGANARLVTDPTGTINFGGPLEVSSIDTFDIVNEGTLNVDASVSLIPDINVPRDPGAPRPVIVPVGLTNTGTVNVSSGGSFTFGAIINNFANDGAVLAGGVWNLLGEAADHSNLSFSGGARIDLRILGYENEDEAFFDIFGGLAAFDTALRTNAADVTLHGRAYFPYFNTVERNEGSLTISGGHRFTTAGGYLNAGGTTTVETGGDLLVQGALRIDGGAVTVGSGSTFTALTETQTFDDGSTFDRTVEVIGGELSVADAGFLASTPMFFDRASPDPRFVGLEAGQHWIVREGVAIDPDTELETVTPATLDLGGAIVERSNGTIIIDGAEARFDAAEAMQYNHGALVLQNGFEFNTRLNDFRNADTLVLQGASFVVEGADGTFRNDGVLAMDGESYLRVDHFINGGFPSGETAEVVFLLDGVLDARRVTISAGTSITGSGAVTGEIVNHGLLDIGNSPGFIETFDDFTTTAASTTRFEILGYAAGESYDRLAVRQLTADPGEPQPDTVLTTLAGTLELIFDPDLAVRPNFTWLLMDNEGGVSGGFDDIVTQGLSAVGDPDAALALIRDADDVLLGELDGLGLFFTAAAGDGNDLAVYSIPEPGTLVTLLALGLLGARRSRREGRPTPLS